MAQRDLIVMKPLPNKAGSRQSSGQAQLTLTQSEVFPAIRARVIEEQRGLERRAGTRVVMSVSTFDPTPSITTVLYLGAGHTVPWGWLISSLCLPAKQRQRAPHRA